MMERLVATIEMMETNQEKMAKLDARHERMMARWTLS
jgi:hypothetical protein